MNSLLGSSTVTEKVMENLLVQAQKLNFGKLTELCAAKLREWSDDRRNYYPKASKENQEWNCRVGKLASRFYGSLNRFS